MRLSTTFVALAACVYSTSAQTLAAATSTSGSLSGLKYTKVGSTGTYNQVTNMIPGNFPNCDANPSCITAPKQISGNLAPFNEEMTFNFRGPMNLFNIAVYQPDAAGATWNQVSSWAAGQAPNNLVFMNNKGGGASGEFSICHGNSQSFANGAFTDAVATANAEIYPGNLPGGAEVNIMTGETCASRACDGFSRGTANHGWVDSKLLVVSFNMPPSADASQVPAIWALNAQVARTAEYGCNCRGVGSPGGCGELDILEVLLGADADRGISEIYAVKGATGSGSADFFARPTGDRVTYGVLFDVASDQIAIQLFDAFDFAQGSVARGAVDAILNAPALEVSFATGARKRGVVGGKPRGNHMH
ncbi:putative TOS1-like glycosyl hydrolase-domain-containing protein [Epithele typhae]|uniref:putative TOS1-like glycosyl hydrolase-domain-containing protein n=1 Tax=Epithele typhae TaxID=378194 RepID=UPI0020081B9B|nr:putative TOS1-like glycosyl hydrolase-domain-containing protein [Epithele typhae]KAH9935101.1 putative TOS1-like glycosyl hydrolase-domain-containing protein [Epithele typhae]